jgi:pentatricopeptide repeat protein
MEAMWASGVQPTLETYSALIGCYGVGGEWERAVATLHVMKKQGLSPGLATYNPLIHRLWSAGEKSTALQVRPCVRVSYQGGLWDSSDSHVYTVARPCRFSRRLSTITVPVSIVEIPVL